MELKVFQSLFAEAVADAFTYVQNGGTFHTYEMLGEDELEALEAGFYAKHAPAHKHGWLVYESAFCESLALLEAMASKAYQDEHKLAYEKLNNSKGFANDVRDTIKLALRHAVEQHGAPNSFSPGELCDEYGGPTPMQAGLYGDVEWTQLGVDDLVYRYVDRRFYVEHWGEHQ